MKRMISAVLAMAMMSVSAMAWDETLPKFEYLAEGAHINRNSLLSSESYLYPEADTIYLDILKEGTTWGDILTCTNKLFKSPAVYFNLYGQDRELVKNYSVAVYRLEGGDEIPMTSAMEAGRYKLYVGSEGYNPYQFYCNVTLPEKENVGPSVQPTTYMMTIHIPGNVEAGDRLVLRTKYDGTIIRRVALTKKQVLSGKVTVKLEGYAATEIVASFE